MPIEASSFKDNRDQIIPDKLLNKLRWFGGLAEMEIYETAARVAVKTGGYKPGNIADPKPGEDAYAFKYDWRRDLVEAAQQLGETIERIKRQQNRPDLKVRLLCHSAGGLVARIDRINDMDQHGSNYLVAIHLDDISDQDRSTIRQFLYANP